MIFRSAYRVAYENERATNERLLALIERLASTLAAVKRRESGLPEREAPPRPDVSLWDDDLERAAQRWGSGYSAQKALALAALRAGKSRFEVLQDLSVEAE